MFKLTIQTDKIIFMSNAHEIFYMVKFTRPEFAPTLTWGQFMLVFFILKQWLRKKKGTWYVDDR